MKTTLIALSLLALSTIRGNAQNTTTKEVQLSSGSNQVRAEIFIAEKKIRVNDDVTYFWFKAREIHYSQGGYEGLLLNGNYSEFYPSEQLREKGQFKNGLKTGEWKSWYENGKLREITNWKDGYQSGVQKKFNEEGILVYEVKFKNGKESTPRFRKKNSLPSDTTRSEDPNTGLQSGKKKQNNTKNNIIPVEEVKKDADSTSATSRRKSPKDDPNTGLQSGQTKQNTPKNPKGRKSDQKKRKRQRSEDPNTGLQSGQTEQNTPKNPNTPLQSSH